MTLSPPEPGVPQGQLGLVRATSEDFDAIYQLCEATMRGYVEADLGDCFEGVARKTLADLIARQLFSKIYRGEAFVGALAFEEHASHYQLEELYIAPAYQNAGLGGVIVRDVMAQAGARRKPVRLHVLASNRAKAFYERLGFAVTRTTRQVNFLEWAA